MVVAVAIVINNRGMTTSSDNEPWKLQAYSASLRLPQLSAEIDLLRPSVGLTELSRKNQTLAGYLLAVTPAGDSSIERDEISEAFVRGNDLVVTYAETEQRPFSLQVYWRVHVEAADIVVLDTILSLQTRLLESFPQVQVATELPAVSANLLPTTDAADSSDTDDLVLAEGETHELPVDTPNGLLLRSNTGDWSFAQATHPQDRGVSRVTTSDSATRLAHQLGGRFMEKGVIRRLRVRGVFTTHENDATVASRYLSRLEAEQPPLTT